MPTNVVVKNDLQTRRRLRVALLMRTASDWSRLVLRGVAGYAHEYGPWDFFIEHRGLQSRLSLPANWTGDGIIARLTDDELEESIRETGLPAVNVSWLGEHCAELPKVVSDERACAMLAAKHFRERGFRNLAYIGPLGSPKYVDRLGQHLKSESQETGCTFTAFQPEPGNTGPTWNQSSDPGPMFARWLQGLPKPAGVMVWSSQIGRKLTMAAQSAAVQIPDDVAVVSAEHDSLMASLAPIPLSNLDQAPTRVGYEGAALLHRLVRGEAPPSEPILVPPRGVVQRQSTDTCAVDDPVVASAVRVIRESGGEPIQVVDLFKAANVSRRVLEQRFQECLGRSPAAEIRRSRLERVKCLLIETDWTVAQIAAKCGFKHPEVLIRMFRREIGLSPTALRRQR